MIPFTIAYLAVLVAVQLVAGGTPASAFAFPVNAALGTLWLYSTWFVWRYLRDKRFPALLFSGRTSIAALALLALCAVAAGLFPQLPHAEAAARHGLWGKLGLYHISSSWIMRGSVLLSLTNLTGVLFRHLKRPRAGFLLNHAGLWLVLAAGLWGGPDRTELRMQVFRGQKSERAYADDGSARLLPFGLELGGFEAQLYPDGSPRAFEALMKSGDGATITASVNDPARYGGYRIYIASYDAARPSDPRYCIVQLVRDPWQPAMLAGILMLLAGAAAMFVQGAVRKNKPAAA